VKKESIVLIGMAGSGKSVTGKALARILGFHFTDLDEYIREKDGLTIQQIIDSRGENYLLQLEASRMSEIDLRHRVVAPGGSIIYQPACMERLKQQSVLVYLNETIENIAGRLKNAQSRGIIGFQTKPLQEIYAERQTLYSRYADITIYPEGRSPEEIAQEIYRQLDPNPGSN
jgi:shikimate kinase